MVHEKFRSVTDKEDQIFDTNGDNRTLNKIVTFIVDFFGTLNNIQNDNKLLQTFIMNIITFIMLTVGYSF